ncbi:MAG TPA: hypothetical protein VIV58_04075, partial [Kofleriaceae bacterium]
MQREQLRGEPGRIAGGNEERPATLAYRLADPWKIAGDDRQARGHRFDHGVREAFARGGVNVDVARRIQARDVVRLAEEPYAVCESEPLDEGSYGRS